MIFFLHIFLLDYKDIHFTFSFHATSPFSSVLLDTLSVSVLLTSDDYSVFQRLEFLPLLCSDFPCPVKQRIVLLPLLKMGALFTGEHNMLTFFDLKKKTVLTVYFQCAVIA